MTAPPPDDAEAGDKLRLKVVAGNAAGTVIEVEDELVIGRQSEGVGSLAEDIEISRRHARIARDLDGRYVIEDLGSTNGTHINGRAVESPVTLEAGDRVEVGASALVVQISTPPATPRSTPVTTTADVAEGAPGSEPKAPVAEPSLETDAAPAEGLDIGVPGVPRLTLRIEVDLEAEEVTVGLDGDAAGKVTFSHEGGSWRLR